MDMAYSVGMLVLALAMIHKIITVTQAAVIALTITIGAAVVFITARKRGKKDEQVDSEK